MPLFTQEQIDSAKGDLYRHYGKIAKEYYGYNVSVIDLRNPTRSDGNNLLHLVNKYMDLWKANPENLAYKAKSEKYAKIIAKTIILSGMDGASFGQNAFFYDAAEGLLCASILLVAEFCPPETRHIVSVFKIIQDLLAPAHTPGTTQFQFLMKRLPEEHKAKWFAGAALNTSEQAMASVMSTALSRLNAFLDSELEQILCFDTAIRFRCLRIDKVSHTGDELCFIFQKAVQHRNIYFRIVLDKTDNFLHNIRLITGFKDVFDILVYDIGYLRLDARELIVIEIFNRPDRIAVLGDMDLDILSAIVNIADFFLRKAEYPSCDILESLFDITLAREFHAGRFAAQHTHNKRGYGFLIELVSVIAIEPRKLTNPGYFNNWDFDVDEYFSKPFVPEKR